MNLFKKTIAAAAVGIMGLTGCGQVADTNVEVSSVDRSGEAIAWSSNDTPSLFSDYLEYETAKLPRSGEAKVTPWTGSYWPTYRDNINNRWAGADTQSPAAKYGEAFDVENLEDAISLHHGIDSVNGDECTTDDDCENAACAKRNDQETGKCVETWFGICHAWAPATIMTPEPKRPVTMNGVEFKINDIKALVTLLHNEVDTKFLSGRCNGNNKKEEIEFDEYGRPVSGDCIDTNPATYHIILANYLGIKKKSFVEDRTFDYEVWNQPMRNYEVTEWEEVTAAKANELIGAEGDTYLFNDNAVKFYRVKNKVQYIGESPESLDGNLESVIDTYSHTDVYEYILEEDSNGRLIGGEWLNDSKINHPDFLWLPTNLKQVDKIAGGKIKAEDVLYLLNQSVAEEGDNGSSAGFNWGGACEAGNGDFEQPIAHRATKTVGDVPAGKANVRIALESSADVDVQLIDKATGHEIIAWPNGDLNGAGEACTTYEGVEYCYSGYNGDGTNLGHEWIEVRGETNRELVMKAYGYAAGDAEVEYSWEAPENCVDTGDGNFLQFIKKSDTTLVGDIPTGKQNIRIELASDKDVDVQVIDKTNGHEIVAWPNGDLNGAGRECTNYSGVEVCYSGYNGVDGKLGHEYITIKGELTKDFQMKAFGYKAGVAKIDYAWGGEAAKLGNPLN